MRVLAAILAASALAGCAVFDAADIEGVRAETIADCSERLCFQGLPDTKAVSESETAEGLSVVTYRSLKRAGSGIRAAGHAAADVVTLGLWEVAGTPIEAELKDKNFYTCRVTFDQDGQVVKFEPGPRLREALDLGDDSEASASS